MAMPVSAPGIPEQSAIPASLLNACFVLFVINAAFFPAAFFAGAFFATTFFAGAFFAAAFFAGT